MLGDIRVSKGVLITTKGYSSTALRRAQQEARDIDLQILPPDRLSTYQFIGCAWLWKGPVAAIVEPPDGWVVDIEPSASSYQFSMYPLGHTAESAKRYCPFLYGSIVLKTDQEPTMEAIAARHESDILEKLPAARFQRLPPLWAPAEGGLARHIFRVGHVDQSYGGPEYSLYLDVPGGVLVLVLLCPEGTDNTYVPAFKSIGASALTMHREHPPQGRSELRQDATRGCGVVPLGLRQEMARSAASGDNQLQVVD
jgi:hypothetical protein